jgi:antitoxin VapB
MSTHRHVRLFRNGRNQAVRIPVEFELPGDEAMIHREGDRLVIEPLPKTSLLEWLATIEPWSDPFPEIDDQPSAPEDIF